MTWTWPSVFIFSVAVQMQVAENWWAPLVSSGPVGAVLIWFMFRNERKMNENTNALNTNTISTAVAVLVIKHMDPAIRELAQQVKDQAEKQRRHEDSSS